MSHYRSNLRDIFFNLFEVLGRDEVLGHGPYEDMDHDTAVAVLTEVEHLATTKLASTYARPIELSIASGYFDNVMFP